jgi:hypothetical protein
MAEMAEMVEMVRMEKMAFQDHLGCLEMKEHQDHPECLEMKVLRDLEGFKVRKVSEEKGGPQVLPVGMGITGMAEVEEKETDITTKIIIITLILMLVDSENFVKVVHLQVRQTPVATQITGDHGAKDIDSMRRSQPRILTPVIDEKALEKRRPSLKLIAINDLIIRMIQARKARIAR